MENLIEKLNLLWASKILNYDYDMLLNNITFLLETLDNGQIHRYELKFKKVSKQYQGKANVCIEIWSKVLLIEADSIELNNENCSLSK